VNLFEEAVFYSDRSRVGILLNNMFSNAIKYQDAGKNSSGLIIDILTSSKEAIIKFSDNGIGIAESHLSRIFEMFYRATEEAKGSGLGLYIAKETVTKLMGDITVQSKLNEGTTFEIRIPNSTDQEVQGN
jgi:signal transduction histidine kinase